MSTNFIDECMIQSIANNPTAGRMFLEKLIEKGAKLEPAPHEMDDETVKRAVLDAWEQVKANENVQ